MLSITDHVCIIHAYCAYYIKITKQISRIKLIFFIMSLCIKIFYYESSHRFFLWCKTKWWSIIHHWVCFATCIYSFTGMDYFNIMHMYLVFIYFSIKCKLNIFTCFFIFTMLSNNASTYIIANITIINNMIQKTWYSDM